MERRFSGTGVIRVAGMLVAGTLGTASEPARSQPFEKEVEEDLVTEEDAEAAAAEVAWIREFVVPEREAAAAATPGFWEYEPSGTSCPTSPSAATYATGRGDQVDAIVCGLRRRCRWTGSLWACSSAGLGACVFKRQPVPGRGRLLSRDVRNHRGLLSMSPRAERSGSMEMVRRGCSSWVVRQPAGRERRKGSPSGPEFAAKNVVLWLAVSTTFAGCACGAPGDTATDASDDLDAARDLEAETDAVVEADDTTEPEDASDGGDRLDAGADELGPPRDIECGNHVVDSGEECHDGNRLNGDECDWLCRSGPGEASTELWPDPAIEPAVPETPPTEIDLGVENSNYLSWGSLGERSALVSDGTSYATVWPHRASDAEDSPIEGTFVRFDVSGRARDAPWTYRLADGNFHDMSFCLLDLAWSGSGYGLMWAGRETVPAGEGPGISFMALDLDGKPLAGPVAIAADSVGFGILGAAFSPEDPGSWGRPVFTWFRVVRP